MRRRSSPSEFRVPLGGGDERRRFESPPGGFRPFGGGFRPMGGGRGHAPLSQLSGQKRGFPFSGHGGLPGSDRFDVASYAKLFVGSVPRTATEEDIRPLFEEHGRVVEVALIKDKRTGQQQGCCFVKYASAEEADRAIKALHNQYTLPGGMAPIQVRYADGERERLGAVEFKLFVGSLNKQATEKEVEEIFSPYGRVEDVYLMRDELKQSRGCGFVKYCQRDMALAAINALNGKFTMRGCDQPLTVRFADPKRPRQAETRSGPAFGGPGVNPRFDAPGARATPNFSDPLSDRVPSNSWHSMSPQNLGPSSYSGICGFGNQLPPRSGVSGMPSNTAVTSGSITGPSDYPFSRPAVPLSSESEQSFNQNLAQVPSAGQQMSPLQKPIQSPQQVPQPIQLNSQAPSAYTQAPTSIMSLPQAGPLQSPFTQTPFNQGVLSQQLHGMSTQFPTSQLPVQQKPSSPTVIQTPLNVNVQPQAVSSTTNQQLLAAPVPQQLGHPLQQPSSQLAQLLTQTQNLQASLQSSQQTFSQLQQQFQLMQPSNHNLVVQSNSQTIQHQSNWGGPLPQTVASSPAGANVPPSTAAVSAIPVTSQALAPVKSNWTEHTSPDGYKYYYNSVTRESKWEKPEEFALYERQQPKPLFQQQLTQIHHQLIPSQQVLQAQVQPQPQQLKVSALPASHQASGVPGQSIQEGGYKQLYSIANSTYDSANFQQGLQAPQELMWKNKPAAS